MVEDFAGLFARTKFNEKLDWDTHNALDMSAMFKDSVNFNQPLNWDTSKVGGMMETFMGAYSFDQELASWDVAKVYPGWFLRMFQGTALEDNGCHKKSTYERLSQQNNDFASAYPSWASATC